MYTEKYVFDKMFTNGPNFLKNVKLVVKIKASSPEMVDSVNELILADRKVTREDISKQ